MGVEVVSITNKSNRPIEVMCDGSIADGIVTSVPAGTSRVVIHPGLTVEIETERINYGQVLNIARAGMASETTAVVPSVTALAGFSGGSSTSEATVNVELPDISYNTPNTFEAGVAITPLVPTNTGDAVVIWEDVGGVALSGINLSLDPNTGVISGIPT